STHRRYLSSSPIPYFLITLFMRPGASLRRACRQFRFNRNLQRLFLLRCQVRSLVFVVKSHQPNLTIGRKVIVDNPQSALCRVARPPTATFVVRWEQLNWGAPLLAVFEKRAARLLTVKRPTSRKKREKWGTHSLGCQKWATRLFLSPRWGWPQHPWLAPWAACLRRFAA